MVEVVTLSDSEISLNSVRYKLIGKVAQALVSVLPGKITIGEYSLADEQVASTWVINDQRGGLLIEEMDEAIHGDRFLWSTCDTRYRGHMTLNPLATQITLPTHTAAGWNQAINWYDAGSEWSDEANAIDGSTTTKATVAQKSGISSYLEVHIPPLSCSKIRYYWSETTGNAVDNLEIDVYYDDAWNAVVTDDSQGEDALAEAALGGTYTVTKARIRMDNGNTEACFFHVIEFYGESATIGGTIGKFVNFDADTYFIKGNTLMKLVKATGATIVSLFAFSEDIVDMFVGLHVATGVSYLLIGLGDDIDYWYISHGTSSATLAEDLDNSEAGIDTSDGGQFVVQDVITIDSEDMRVDAIAGATLTVTRGYWESTAATHTSGAAIITSRIAQSNQDDFTLGISWDEKCQKVDATGQLDSSVDPASATPTWTDKGKLRLEDSSINSLAIYRDADADPQVYAGTKGGLWIHDFTNAKWIETELSLPNHSNGGKGLVNWRDALFNSSGLHVDKYIAAGTATIESVGLDEGDGLPAEFNGEILFFADGHRAFHALVDANEVTGTGYSGVYDYDGKGWRCIWIGATADDTMHAGIETTVHTYGLLFDHNDLIYRIPLQGGIQSPLKIATHTYNISGMHITPWFDAGWIGPKLALSLKMMCAGMSATEKITAYYRTDHSTTTIPVAAWTGWAKLTSATYADGVTAAGEAEFEFGTLGIGVTFKAIQFAFDFERTNVTPATDKLKTPDLQYVKLKYLKQLDKQWGWNVTIDCRNEYDGNTPSQLIAAIETLATPGTLKEFTFRDDSGGDETHYVTLKTAAGAQKTGENWAGVYQLELVAP